MKVVLRTIAVLCVALAAFLIFAIISAVGSAGGANVPVCIGYAIASAILVYVARLLWLRPAHGRRAAKAPSGS
jgi:hypothetical protein